MMMKNDNGGSCVSGGPLVRAPLFRRCCLAFLYPIQLSPPETNMMSGLGIGPRGGGGPRAVPEQPKQDNADDGGTHSIQINAVPMMTRDDEGLASGLLTSGK